MTTQTSKWEKYSRKKAAAIKNPGNKAIVEDYILTRREIENKSWKTINIDTQAISALCDFIKDKPLTKVTRNDMLQFKQHHSKESSPTTLDLRLLKIKRFYKYVSNPERYKKSNQDRKEIEYPTCVKWITTKNGNGDSLPLDSIPTEKDIEKLLKACHDIREQCLICALADGGFRKGELIGLKVKNLGFNDIGVKITLPKKERGQHRTEGQKTGQRVVQFFIIPSSTAYFREYMNHHPERTNPNAPLFYSMQHRQLHLPPSQRKLSDNALNDITSKIGKQAGIPHLHPHLLRHMSATFCALRGFNESMLRNRFGWSKNSSMPSYYVHFAESDQGDFIRGLLGIKPKEKNIKSKLTPITCPNCNTENPFDAKYCYRCSRDLTQDPATMAINATDVGIVMQQLMKNPEMEKQIGKILLEQLQKLQNKSF